MGTGKQGLDRSVVVTFARFVLFLIASGLALCVGSAAQTPEEASLTLLDVGRADVLIWKAGRPSMPGLSASRASERETLRTAALDEMRVELSPDAALVGPWLDHIASRLEGTHETDELWCATARVVGRLSLYQWASKLAFELGGGRPVRRRIAAQEALHHLYGRWFEEAEEVGPFVELVEAGDGTRLLLRELAGEEKRANTRLLESLEAAPERAVDWLDDADPRLRAGAASILGEALAAGRVEAATVLDPLFQRLREEHEPHAYHAVLEAIVTPLEGEAEDSERLVELRTLLLQVIDEPGIERSLPVVRALSRMPWSTEPGDSSDGLAWGVSQIGRVLERLTRPNGPGVEIDADAVVGTIEALHTLCIRARGSALADELRRSDARQPVFAILQDPARSEVTRSAAVAALEVFALPEDWRLLVDVLVRADSPPALSYALLGSLRAILIEFDPENPGSRELMERVAELSGAADPDLRRRALALLGEGDLEAMVGLLDPQFLITRLEEEEVSDLTRSILTLVRRFGTPEMLPVLLELERFDEFATGDSELFAELATTLEALADGRAADVLAAGGRLVGVPADDMRLRRVRRALRMAAALELGAARALQPAQHREVCVWARELHTAGVSLRDEVQEGGDFLGRLLDLHLVQSGGESSGDAQGPPFGEGARTHLMAVAGADQIGAEDAQAAARVEELFARALELAPNESDPRFADLVLRDRARFRVERGEQRAALNDFQALLDKDALGNSDVRRAVSILGEIAGSEEAERQRVAPRVCDFLLWLVRRDSWPSEPPAVRMQDLRELGTNAILAGNPERLRQFLALLEGLPDAPPENGNTSEAGAAWEGLVRDAERLEELRRLAAEARAALPAEPEPAAATPSGETQEKVEEPQGT